MGGNKNNPVMLYFIQEEAGLFDCLSANLGEFGLLKPSSKLSGRNNNHAQLLGKRFSELMVG